MTEADWLSCSSPEPMLAFLRDRGVSERKRRLFACAVAAWLSAGGAGETQRAIDEVERIAASDTLAGCETVLAEVRSKLVWEFYESWRRDDPPFATVGSVVTPSSVVGLVMGAGAFNELHSGVFGVVVETLLRSGDRVGYNQLLFRLLPLSPDAVKRYREPTAVAVLRDIVPNPFRPATLAPSYLTPTVTALAQRVYETRDFSAMPILADALEDAGCSDAEVLGHCRGGGVHVRGCWVVDLVLGKS